MTIQEVSSASAMIKQELEPLAQKIGEGVEWTYALFVKQVYVNAFGSLLWMIPGIIGIISTIKLWKRVNGTYEPEPVYFMLIILFLGSLTAILLPIFGLIQAFINPDFVAIQLILDMVKGEN